MKRILFVATSLFSVFTVQACAVDLKPGSEFQDCKDCPVMVVLPRGDFMMGALPYDEQADKYEKPRHPVEIKHDFYMGKYEVTYGQYLACVREGGCSFTPPDMLAECHKRLGCSAMYRKEPVDINKLPVVGVSYNDAMEYVVWLSGKAGEAYRLPTEEEWEYAARAGTETIFWWGDEMEDGRAMCSDCDIRNHMQTLPMHVGSYPPNPFGLYDMLGNAQEITGGCSEIRYSIKFGGNTSATLESCERRTLRGSSWLGSVFRTRASQRVFTPSVKRWVNDGFRVAKDSNKDNQGDEK